MIYFIITNPHQKHNAAIRHRAAASIFVVSTASFVYGFSGPWKQLAVAPAQRWYPPYSSALTLRAQVSTLPSGVSKWSPSLESIFTCISHADPAPEQAFSISGLYPSPDNAAQCLNILLGVFISTLPQEFLRQSFYSSRFSSIHSAIPVSVGSRNASSVHRTLPVSFLIVSSVVLHGQ